MDIDTLKLVFFSPTGTTRKVVENIARGINCRNVTLIDITKPSARKQVIASNAKELLIVAVPVYMGRVPALLFQCLHSIEATGTPAVAVVVYGNRAFENALLELKDTLSNCGCKVFAGAAFIGEHSFSSDEFPSSVGRPDTEDLQKAELFGQKIAKALQKASSPHELTDVKLPGSYPYVGVTDLWHIDFIDVNEQCTQCGICFKGCPVDAIDPSNSSIIDKDKCTLCCACIKNCPQHAKSMKHGLMRDAASRCATFIERHEPECYMESEEKTSIFKHLIGS